MDQSMEDDRPAGALSFGNGFPMALPSADSRCPERWISVGVSIGGSLRKRVHAVQADSEVAGTVVKPGGSHCFARARCPHPPFSERFCECSQRETFPSPRKPLRPAAWESISCPGFPPALRQPKRSTFTQPPRRRWRTGDQNRDAKSSVAPCTAFGVRAQLDLGPKPVSARKTRSRVVRKASASREMLSIPRPTRNSVNSG
jgi:hypothetical protein